MKEASFVEKLNKAATDTKGKEARHVLNQVLPILDFAGKKSAFGSFEKSQAVHKIFEISRRYGCPSLFLTMSFDDVNNPSSIRMAMRSSTNTSFPATDDPEFIQHLIDGSDLIGKGSISIPSTVSERAKIAADNPIAFVFEFKTLLADILTILLGIPPDNFGSLKKKTKYFRFKQKGIFGHILAFYGCIEEHKKKTLHSHICAWGGLAPDVLQKFAHVQEICNAIATVLNKMHIAKLSDEAIITNSVQKILRNNNINIHFQPKTPPSVLQNIADWKLHARNEENESTMVSDRPPFASESIVCNIENQAVKQQWHHHMFTCRSGFNGHTGCRLCKPSGLCELTMPMILKVGESIRNSNGDIEDFKCLSVPVSTQHTESVQTSSWYPDNPTDFTEDPLIVWELLRPRLKSQLECIKNETHDKNIRADQICQIENILNQFLVEEPTDANSPLQKFIREMIQNFTAKKAEEIDKIYQDIYTYLEEGNGYIVEFSPILSFCTGSHNAAMILGSTEQGKSALFYLTNYVSKGKFEMEECLSVLKEANQHIEQYPSLAENTGTAQRTAMHVLTRTLNKLNLHMEISDYQIAAALLGLPTEITSESFVYIRPQASVAFMEFDKNSKNVEKDIVQIFNKSNSEESDAETLASDEEDSMYELWETHCRKNFC